MSVFSSYQYFFDFSGNPSWNLEMGDIKSPTITLDEIFYYLEQADKPCLISIDEFQVIAKYPESDVEATLRTHINTALMQDSFMLVRSVI